MKKLSNIFLAALMILVMQQNANAQEWQYVVKEGDSLWSIADQYSIHYSYVRRLQQHNNINNPLYLQVGQTISMPVEWLGNLPSTVVVKQVNGEVELIRDGRKSDLALEMELKADDLLTTGENGSALLEFADKSSLKVFADTKLVFSTLKQSYDGSVIKLRVNVEQGRLDVDANSNSNPGHLLEIGSPSAVTAVRGTKLRVGVNDSSNQTVTEVLTGEVVVSAANANVPVRELHGTIAKLGDAPIRPVPLLKAPEIKLPPVIETKRATLGWEQMKGAEYYRVRVAGKADFSDIFYDQVIRGTQAKDIFFPRDGAFFASIRAADNNGIEGLDATIELSVNARPEPPFAISPMDAETSFNDSPEFSWTQSGDSIEKQHYQISSKQDFSSVLLDKTVESGEILVLEQPLQEGDYFWRVANIDQMGRGPYSRPFMFTVKSQPQIDSELLKSEAGSQLSLSLSKDATVSRYRVQVSRDVDFKSIIFDDWVEGESFAFNTEGAGSYYIRLGIEDTITDSISYSDAQKIIVPFKEWGKVLLSLTLGLLFAL